MPVIVQLYCRAPNAHIQGLMRQRPVLSRFENLRGAFFGFYIVSPASTKQDRMGDHAGPLFDLSHAAPDIISMVLGSMTLRERFNSALVCKA